MPTGYTAEIHDGKDVSFPQFVMGCSRAFGALITMRDDPADAEIPDEFAADTRYHDEAIARAEDDIKRLSVMSDEKADRQAQIEYKQQMDRWLTDRKKARELAERYDAMLAEVEAWEPPTPDHVGLKEFMTNQLSESKRFDCSTDEQAEHWKPQRVSGTVWRAAKLAKARRDVAYHSEERAKEIERAEGRTAWVRALRDSLKVARSDGYGDGSGT